MIKGVEMERVVITLLIFLNSPIDWIPMGIILRNRRWYSQEPRKEEEGGVIGRCRIDRQMTYCQMRVNP
jgi:hypothetical protein